MNKMLELLRWGQSFEALCEVPDRVYFTYFGGADDENDLHPDDLTTMLLLIAVAEGETL